MLKPMQKFVLDQFTEPIDTLSGMAGVLATSTFSNIGKVYVFDRASNRPLAGLAFNFQDQLCDLAIFEGAPPADADHPTHEEEARRIDWARPAYGDWLEIDVVLVRWYRFLMSLFRNEYGPKAGHDFLERRIRELDKAVHSAGVAT